MPITVRLFAAARSAAGTDEVRLEPGSLEGVTTELIRQYPDLGSVLPRCSYLVNGTAVHGDIASINIADGDDLDVLPPFAGG